MFDLSEDEKIAVLRAACATTVRDEPAAALNIATAAALLGVARDIDNLKNTPHAVHTAEDVQRLVRDIAYEICNRELDKIELRMLKAMDSAATCQ